MAGSDTCWTLSRWVGAAVSTIGRGHLAAGLPCQDSSAAAFDDDLAIVVVSDGAGSARRSELGSAAVVGATVRALRATAPWPQASSARDQVLTACREALARRAEEVGCAIADLAATLAFVAVAGRRFVAGNLGDGIVAGFRGSAPEVLVEPVRGEFVNETVFLTSRQAREWLRLVAGPLDGFDGFTVTSDGAAERLYQRATQTVAPALSRILCWFDSHPPVAVREAVDRSAMPLLAERTQDDCSVALLRRVCVDMSELAGTSVGFQKAMLGCGNRRGLRNRLAVLEKYAQGAEAAAEATGLSQRTVVRHRRALRSLLVTGDEHQLKTRSSSAARWTPSGVSQ